MTKAEIHSNLPIPPGEFLVEVLNDLGIEIRKATNIMDIREEKLSAVIKGNESITKDIALKLEKTTKVPKHIWIGLENEYRLVLAQSLGIL